MKVKTKEKSLYFCKKGARENIPPRPRIRIGEKPQEKGG